ncbi:MAG: hypothetical protein WC862_02915 [Patescibacteria group bacterium]
MLIKAGEIIFKSIELYKKNWQLFFRYAGLYLISTMLIITAQLIFKPIEIIGDSARITRGFYPFVPVAIVASIASIWFSIAFLRAISARYQGSAPGAIMDELKKATKLIIPSVLALLLVMAIVFGGLLLLIIPGIIFSLWFAFSFYAIALDEHKVMASLKESRKLVKNRWFAVFWRLFAPGFVFGATASIAQWIVALIFGFLGNSAIALLFAGLFTTIANLFFVPLTTAATTILYLELKKTPNKIVAPKKLPPAK